MVLHEANGGMAKEGLLKPAAVEKPPRSVAAAGWICRYSFAAAEPRRHCMKSVV
jgi:hypothetical protein